MGAGRPPGPVAPKIIVFLSVAVFLNGTSDDCAVWESGKVLQKTAQSSVPFKNTATNSKHY